jgi:putative hydrolase of the HAD superfamily
MQHIQAVAFDLFDTLVTVGALGFEEAMGRAVQSLQTDGLPIQAEAFLPVYRQMSLQFVEQARRDGRESHNRFWISGALHRMGHAIHPHDDRVGQAVDAYFSAFLEHAVPLPKTHDMLKALQPRYRLGLVSNFTHGPAAREILNRHELSDFFDVIVISGEFGYRKPHVSIFNELVDRMGVPSVHIAYVGDDIENDVSGSHRAGMRPIFTQCAKVFKGTALQPQPEQVERVKQLGAPTISDWDELQSLLSMDKDAVGNE